MNSQRNLLFITLWTLLSFTLAQTDAELAGIWEGSLEQAEETLTVLLTLEQTETWQGTLSIPEEAREQALVNIVVEGNELTFEVEEIFETAATFEGALIDGELTGTLNQNDQSVALTLNPQTAQEQPKLSEAQILELGQAFTEQLYNGDYEGLAGRFTEDMLEAMDAQALEQLWQQLKGQIGGEAELIEESVMFQMDLGVYQRSARFGNGEKAIVQWVINDEGIIEGFTIRPDRSG